MRGYIDPSSIRPLGELGARTLLLAGRLTDAMYRPGAIFTGDQNGWPGDWEGRTILAQTLISRVSGVESPYLRANVEALADNLNEKGYLKGILPEGELDEQQLSGHGWLVRGLCEYSEYAQDKGALEMALRMAEELFLPTAGHFDDYPTKPEERSGGGEAAGNISGKLRGWYLSTDTGCAFIPMDGLSRLYELTGDKRLMALMEEMYARFIAIDLVGARVQTHATLSACRGILRLYGVTGDEKYLDSARSIFDIYVRSGMTATYANQNWFARPEWTEPCAIIDSFIVAMRLFEYVGDPRYADMARRIWSNGVCRAQRPNGGFGCDSCAGEGGSGAYLKVHAYEAYWCCTMRGGEGLDMGARFCYMTDGDTIIVPMFASSLAEFDICGGHVRIRQRADSARDGHVEFKIEENTAERPVKLSVLMPDWASTGGRYAEYELPGAGERIALDFHVPLVRDDAGRLMWGDMLLGTEDDVDMEGAPERSGSGFIWNGARLAPIADCYLMDPAELGNSVTRVLFQ